MKKLIALLFATIMLVLPSCNEDATENDVPLTNQLKGSWQMKVTTEEESTTYTFQFRDGVFYYKSEYFKKANEEKGEEEINKSWTVSGTWNITKGVLQLCYDTTSANFLGYSEEDIHQFTQSMIDNNYVLKEMNKDGKVYGLSVDFETINGTNILRLGGFNGHFTRVY